MTLRPNISLIVPIYQEEKYIQKFLDSLHVQTYPLEKIQFILIDGMSKDNTRQIIKEYISQHPELDILLLENPKRFQVYALNIGIKAANGDIIVRLDAHSRFPDNYLELCVQTLIETGADNVGGLAITKGTNDFSNIAAKLLSSRFGVGNSDFRTYAKSGYVETVPFGTYRKELFKEIGLFDERLIRNEDNEFNGRIIKNGGKIFLNSDIKFDYFCRDNYSGLMDYACMNGMWNIITLYLTKNSMRVRHFVPFLFFLYLIVGLILSIIFPFLFKYWFIVLIVYLILDIVNSLVFAKNIKEFLYLFFLFPSFHIVYGFGSFVGLLKIIFRKI